MSEAIYIQKPEDIINLSPDRENDAKDKDKNHINNKYRHNDIEEEDETNNEQYDKPQNNNEINTGNYYVKEPGMEDSINSEVNSTGELDTFDARDLMNDESGVELDDDVGHDCIPLEPLALNESFEENSRRLVEVDDEGNTMRSHSRVPSKYNKTASPKQSEQTEKLLQALARLDLETIPTESPSVQPVLGPDEDYLTPRTHEHIYAEIVDKKIERQVKPTGSIRIVENERRVRVPIIRRLTRTFSINRRHGHGIRNSSSTLYRDRFSKLPKTPPEKENVTCSCNRKLLACALVILVLLLLSVIAAVLLTMVLNDDSKSDKIPRPKDVIFPTVTCPTSQIITLTQHTKTVTLGGAETKDNTGIKLLQYRAIIEDDSATYKKPDKLVLSRDSVGNKYVIAVTTKDLDDNEAVCNYTVSVEDDLCVPWRLPEVQYATREEVEIPGGWQITYKCSGHSSDTARQPHMLSYYYLDNPTTFTCYAGQRFTPEKSFSCQKADLARYKYITSINYQFLDNDGTQLENITMGKAKNCFTSYYSKRLLNIQQKKAMQLEEVIKNSASSSTFGDVSQMELAPIVFGYPEISEFSQNNGKVHAMKVVIGYQIGPHNQAYPPNLLNVYVRGIIQTQHTTLFLPDMAPFSRVHGNVNARCPDIQAPATSTLFEPVDSGFMCNEGEKRHRTYDDHIEADVTVCLGCQVGEFYNSSTTSCQQCALGSYQDTVGTLACRRCPPNTTTINTGAIDDTDCIPA